MYCEKCGSKLNKGICPNCNKNNVKKTNAYAIIGFVLSFFVSIAGLILSIIGLKKSKDFNDGKGLSIAGIIISSISLVIKIFVIVIAILGFIYSFNMYPNLRKDIIDNIRDNVDDYDDYYDDDNNIENVSNAEVIDDIYDKGTFILILNDIDQEKKNELINIIKEKGTNSTDFDIYMTNYTSKLSSLISTDTKYAIVISGDINTYKVDEYDTFKNDINKYLLNNIEDITYDNTKLYEITDDYEKWPTIKTNEFKYEKVHVNKEMAVVGAYGITNITNTGIGAQIYVKFYDENKNYLTEFNTLKCSYYNNEPDNLFYLKPNEIKSISFPMYEVDESGCGIELEKFKQAEYFSIDN